MRILNKNSCIGLALLAILVFGLTYLVLRNRPKDSVAEAPGPVVTSAVPESVSSPNVPPAKVAVYLAKNTGARPLSADLSPALRTLIGLTPEVAELEKRQAALRTLTRHLSAAEIDALLGFLETHFSNYQGLRPIALNGIKNDILDVLLRQDQPVTNLGARIVAMFRDPKQDEVWRDYCIQFLAPYYSITWVPPAPGATPVPVTDGARQEIAAACWDAAAQSNKGIAGTALIGLESLSRKYPEFDRVRIGNMAVTLANDEETCEATRITALRLCGKLKRAEALETARIVTQTGSSLPLRMAAIATLGDLGEQRDLEYLQAVIENDAPRLKPVMAAAVNKIRTRMDLDKG